VLTRVGGSFYIVAIREMEKIGTLCNEHVGRKGATRMGLRPFVTICHRCKRDAVYSGSCCEFAIILQIWRILARGGCELGS